MAALIQGGTPAQRQQAAALAPVAAVFRQALQVLTEAECPLREGAGTVAGRWCTPGRECPDTPMRPEPGRAGLHRHLTACPSVHRRA